MHSGKKSSAKVILKEGWNNLPTSLAKSNNILLSYFKPSQLQNVSHFRPTQKDSKAIRRMIKFQEKNKAVMLMDPKSIINTQNINTYGKIKSLSVLAGPGKGVRTATLSIFGFATLNAAIALKRNRYLDSPHAKPVDMSTREGAFEGSKHYKKGTVGYGVNASIKAIYLLFGELGAARIGEVFNSPEAQEIMSREDTRENRLAIANLEYNYWVKVSKEAEASLNDKVGGYAGASFSPEVRAAIQFRMGLLRSKINGE